MFEPKYLILLDKRAFFPEEVVCLGSQLKSIIKNLIPLLKPHIWFCADIDAFSPVPTELEIDTFQLKKIGDSNSLIDLCEKIDQFFSGVFIAINNKCLNHLNVYVDTEDPRFRSLEIEGVLIEIRAFDTSYFEIYSEDLNLMIQLSKIYGVRMEKADENSERNS